MSWMIAYQGDADTVVTRAARPLDRSQVRQQLREAIAEAARHDSRKILLDCRDTYYRIPESDAISMPQSLRELGLEPSHRLAIVFSPEMRRIFEFVHLEGMLIAEGLCVKVFAKEDEAHKWLQKEEVPTLDFAMPDSIIKRWQELVDVMAVLMGVPAGLIMRITREDIEVFVSSDTQGNPYHKGDREHLLGSGLYCETVVKTKERLLVPNAIADEKWAENPDVKLDMISYLGFPIMLPNGMPFGTICVLDNKENTYSETYEKLMTSFKELLESQLELIYANHLLGLAHERLSEYIGEVRALRGIIPICANCKKVRNDEGYWEAVEGYVSLYSDAVFSSGICPECMRSLYPEYSE